MNLQHARRTVVFILGFFASILTSAQEKGAVQYLSPVDEQLTVYRLCLFRTTDNARGIYAKPLQEKLDRIIEAEGRFRKENCPRAGTEFTPPETHADKHDIVKRKFEDSTAQAAMQLGVYIQNESITLRLYLFLKADGTALIQETQENIKNLDVANLELEVEKLFKRVVHALPYDAVILSREQNRVTLNAGMAEGAQVGQVLKVIRIIRTERHPRFQFLIKSDQVLIGSIRLTKVDRHLSFGEVAAESAPEAITTSSKVTGLRDLSSTIQPGNLASPVTKRPDGSVVFGEKPEEWLPEDPPTFGMVGARLGLGFFQEKSNVAGVGPLDSKSTLYPRLSIHGEAWITSRIIARARILQGIVNIDNPREDSEPSELSINVAKYELAGGYRYTFSDDFFGPHLFGLLGASSTRFFIDDSTPTAFTTVQFQGFFIEFGGEFTLGPKDPWSFGADVRLHLFPALKEEPVTSGGDTTSNQVNEFSVFAGYRLSQRLMLRGSVDFALYSAALKGMGSRDERASNISVRDNSLNFGADYYF